MTHLHEKSGCEFEVGSYVDGDKFYDMTVVSYWKDAETEGVGAPVEIVGYYFGGYDEDWTNHVIDTWLANRKKEIRVLQAAKVYLNAYLITNYDVLDKADIIHLEESLKECNELAQDREWEPTPKHDEALPPAFKMRRAEFVGFIHTLRNIGNITNDAEDTLLELAINFPE